MFTLFFTKPTYNQARTYWQSYNRYAGSKAFKSLEEAIAYIPELENKGCTNFSIRSNTGKRVF